MDPKFEKVSAVALQDQKVSGGTFGLCKTNVLPSRRPPSVPSVKGQDVQGHEVPYTPGRHVDIGLYDSVYTIGSLGSSPLQNPLDSHLRELERSSRYSEQESAHARSSKSLLSMVDELQKPLQRHKLEPVPTDYSHVRCQQKGLGGPWVSVIRHCKVGGTFNLSVSCPPSGLRGNLRLPSWKVPRNRITDPTKKVWVKARPAGPSGSRDILRDNRPCLLLGALPHSVGDLRKLQHQRGFQKEMDGVEKCQERARRVLHILGSGIEVLQAPPWVDVVSIAMVSIDRLHSVLPKSDGGLNVDRLINEVRETLWNMGDRRHADLVVTHRL
ncbi:uncharacterized protein [Dendrobates tinctorius]|uniref:uncharacterized protein n=1 Tax=Dendrobates tinctorius TaxID=92724 RepID=UPI003CC96DE2